MNRKVPSCCKLHVSVCGGHVQFAVRVLGLAPVGTQGDGHLAAILGEIFVLVGVVCLCVGLYDGMCRSVWGVARTVDTRSEHINTIPKPGDHIGLVESDP